MDDHVDWLATIVRLNAGTVAEEQERMILELENQVADLQAKYVELMELGNNLVVALQWERDCVCAEDLWDTQSSDMVTRTSHAIQDWQDAIRG